MLKNTITFLPSFVGSKSYWIEDVRLLTREHTHFVEPFAGSAVLSANCASTAHLNDFDPILCRILAEFDQQIVPEEFTREEYYEVRGQDDWWRYAFCLSRMAFSGIFRHTKHGGFNVQAKPSKNYDKIHVREQYLQALTRWKRLKPTITSLSYIDIDPILFEGKTVILDPPYEGSLAWDNWCQNLRSHNAFNYTEYWRYVTDVRKYAAIVLLFDKRETILTHLSLGDILFYKQKKSRPNGRYSGNTDAMVSLTTTTTLK